MKVLFASLGNYGHVFPLIPLAQAAQAAGHEVWFATSEQFHPTVEKAELRPVASGLTVPEAFIEAAGGQAFLEANGGTVQASDVPPEVLASLAVKAFGSVLPRSAFADLTPVLDSVRPDLVVYESFNPGAAFAAAAAGVPAVGHSIGRVSPDPLIPQELFATASDLGVADKIGQGPTLGNPYIDICPAAVQNPEFLASGAQVIPQRPVPYSEPGELPAHVTQGEGPLIYLSFGTVVGSAELLRTAIDGLLPLGVRVLVATSALVDPAELGELPDRVVTLPWVPQLEALRHATAIVHHGGHGTTLASLATGLPQLILPRESDGLGNAPAVQATGAGRLLLGEDVSAEAVETEMRTLLTDEAHREAARRVAGEIAALPGPADTVARFPEFVG